VTVRSAPSFEPVADWEHPPEGQTHRDVSDVAVDSSDRVFLLTREDSRVSIYDRDGGFIKSWGEDVLTARPHGITIGPDNSVYCVDEDDQTIRRFTPDGEQLSVIGVSGVTSDTGVDWSLKNLKERTASISQGGPPFNHPTKLAVAPNGHLYVTDGYGNARVHHFTSDGELVASWGEPGVGPGQFHLPHCICVTPDQRVLVADRENDRIQVFTLDGNFVQAWTDLQRPTAIALDRDGLIYVTELAWLRGQYSWVRGPIEDAKPARLSILDPGGNVLIRFGAGTSQCAAGNFAAPHGIAIDSRGDLYVAEVIYSFLIKGRGEVDPHLTRCHTIQKLVRTADS
jgi:DNA-binding beta-propeller fold protein YncE